MARSIELSVYVTQELLADIEAAVERGEYDSASSLAREGIRRQLQQPDMESNGKSGAGGVTHE